MSRCPADESALPPAFPEPVSLLIGHGLVPIFAQNDHRSPAGPKYAASGFIAKRSELRDRFSVARDDNLLPLNCHVEQLREIALGFVNVKLRHIFNVARFSGYSQVLTFSWLSLLLY